MSRIISGAAGGVRLASVPGDNTRPTTDRVKESLFSKLESYDLLRDARVLDAFGGSGALGCEALSRGAASVTLLDTYPKAVAVIRRNVEAVQKAMGGKASGSVARVQQSWWWNAPRAMRNPSGAASCTASRPASTARRCSTTLSPKSRPVGKNPPTTLPTKQPLTTSTPRRLPHDCPVPRIL